MIRVIIADDFPAIEKVMRRLLARAEDMELVGTAVRFDDALKLVKEVPHDVIILNDYLAPLRSPIAIRRMREAGVESAIVVVSMHEDAELAQEALEEGANGYVLKPNFMEEFVRAIREAYAGNKFSSPEIAAELEELSDDTDELMG